MVNMEKAQSASFSDGKKSFDWRTLNKLFDNYCLLYRLRDSDEVTEILWLS